LESTVTEDDFSMESVDNQEGVGLCRRRISLILYFEIIFLLTTPYRFIPDLVMLSLFS